MGKVIVVQFVTLDGVSEDPDGSDGTPFGGWALRFGYEAIGGDKFLIGEQMSTGVLLFGRRTWDHFAELWSPRTTEFAGAMNSAAKAVATSRPLDEGAWNNSSAITGSLVDWVKATTTGKDVVVIGSTSVVRELEAADLIDEYRLLVFPTATGAGKQLFTEARELQLVSAQPSGPGTLSIYERTAR